MDVEAGGVRAARTMVGCFNKDCGCREEIDEEIGGEGALRREEMVDMVWARAGEAGGGDGGSCLISTSSEKSDCPGAEAIGKHSVSISGKRDTILINLKYSQLFKNRNLSTPKLKILLALGAYHLLAVFFSINELFLLWLISRFQVHK